MRYGKEHRTPMADVSVRPARPEDAQAVGQVQLRAWRAAYADVLPAKLLAELTAEALAERWRQAVTERPSPRHHVLVAVEAGQIVGFAAFGPAEDPDRDAAHDGELYTLLVDPAAGRRGHGSRLLAATADLLREDGCRTAVTWVLSTDDVLRRFLTEAGWAPDGSRRDLDLLGDGTRLARQVRLHTDLRQD
ncbi:GCN5-related N-acetyltransferase [Carbonactinospora thermoautotrophica]|uniref:GCN5-related N-acetyltransferase n=2 Tax=Carbonactinospora thermoautotrophica TaxID=1469144 RepID=A0A132MPR4_9ACTN|nr:GCN5-related N-acetyltransferase [Carbonactinospora thermoautotrophica]